MSTDGLTKKQEAAAIMLANTDLEKQHIADQLEISRTTLFNWETKNDLFKARVHELKREFQNFGQQLMEAKLVEAVQGYWNLIQKTNNDMVAKNGYEFFIERSLGKVANNVKLTTEIENVKKIDQDILEAEFETFDNESE